MIRILKASFKIFKTHFRNHPVAMGIFMFCAFLLIGIEVWFFFAAPPAKNWLSQNLQNIKNTNYDNYAFAVFGDNKNSHATFPELLREVSADKELSFAIDIGDMVFDGEMEKYRYFFRQVHKNMKIPLLTAIGNHELHEKGRGLYYDLFGPFYYSFKVGRDYFIVIDDANEKGLDQWQQNWLEKELQKAADYSHRFVFMHVPLFDPRGAGHHHCLPAEVAHPLLDLFKKYKVSHVFASHIHSYYTGDWEGIPYTITGGAGGELVGKNPDHDFFHYLKVSVKDSEVKISVMPIKTPDFEWLDRIGSMAWIYFYALIRLHGVEIAILLLMAYALAVAFEIKGPDKY
ncbi:MAG: metallophosphoesterase [Deltaproteobacteria bacterium]|nr:metallophosphoesterase [Deltaproteobacteria bacterium]